MPASLTLHVLIGCPFAKKALLTALCLGLNVRFVFYDHKWHLKTQEFLKMNPKGTVPVLETDHGVLSESDVIVRYLANLDAKKSLNGRTHFEKAMVEEWISKCAAVYPHIFAAKFKELGLSAGQQKDVSDAYNKFPMHVKEFEEAFGKGTYILGDHISTADIALFAILWDSARSCILPANVMKRLPNLTKWFNNMASQEWFTKMFGRTFENKAQHKVPEKKDVEAYVSDPKNNPVNIAREKQGLPLASEAPKSGNAKAKDSPKKPLTGKAAVQAKLAEQKKKEEEKKKAKAPIIAKSQVTFDIKGYEADQDWETMANKIRSEIKPDGLVWMDKHKVLPVAFGVKKLQMVMIIEDEKIQTDDIFEIIEEWEDVQSTDIVAFAKA